MLVSCLFIPCCPDKYETRLEIRIYKEKTTLYRVSEPFPLLLVVVSRIINGWLHCESSVVTYSRRWRAMNYWERPNIDLNSLVVHLQSHVSVFMQLASQDWSDGSLANTSRPLIEVNMFVLEREGESTKAGHFLLRDGITPSRPLLSLPWCDDWPRRAEI